MSDSQQYEKVSVSSDGVTVDKRFEEDEFPVPAIAFEIQSERTVTVSITLVDQVPQDVAVEDLGFHPEYGSEYWTIDENEIAFEREIEANSEYTTVYGIRATGTDNVEQFLTEPTIETVDPPLEDDAESVVEGDGSDVVRDVISGDSDSVPGLEDDEDDDVETLDLKDPNAPDDEDTGSTVTADTSTDTSTDSTSTESADSPSLAESGVDASTLCGALATEIRNGNVDEDDVKLLRKAFDLAGEESGSTEARIKRLQTEVADLLAYTDSLEEFLDENGTGNELIEGFREDLEEFESDVEEIRELAESHEDALEDIEATVDSVESSVESVESEMDSVLADVKSVEEEVEDVSDEVEDVSEDVEELEEQVGDIDVSSIESEIEDIEEEIEDLKEWREQLSSVIGGE